MLHAYGAPTSDVIDDVTWHYDVIRVKLQSSKTSHSKTRTRHPDRLSVLWTDTAASVSHWSPVTTGTCVIFLTNPIGVYTWHAKIGSVPFRRNPIRRIMEKYTARVVALFYGKISYSVSFFNYICSQNFPILQFWAFATFLVCSITFYLFYSIRVFLNARKTFARFSREARMP